MFRLRRSGPAQSEGARRHSAQKPESCAKERDEVAVARWLTEDWPRIQKKPKPRAPTSCSSTKAASV